MKKTKLVLVLFFLFSVSAYGQDKGTGEKKESETESSENFKKRIKEAKESLKRIRILNRLKKRKERITGIEFDSLITYNVRERKISDFPTYYIHQNGSLIFDIKDINLLRYKVTLIESHNDIISRTPLGQGGKSEIELEPLFFNLSDVNLKTPNINAIVPEFKKDSSILDAIIKKERDIDSENQTFNREYERYKVAKKFLEHSKVLKEKINSIQLSEAQENKKDSLNSELEKLKIKKKLFNEERVTENEVIVTKFDSVSYKHIEDIGTLNSDLLDLKLERDRILDEAESAQAKVYKFNLISDEYKNTLEGLNSLTNLYKRLLNNLYSDKSWKEIELERDKIVADIIPHIEKVSNDNILKDCQFRLKKVECAFNELSAFRSYNSTNDDINKLYFRIEAFNNQINSQVFSRLFDEIVKVYDATNESNFNLKYETLIVSDNADVITFNLSAEPLKKLPASIELTPINLNYNVKIISGVKLDISTGFFWNLGLNDNSYRFEKVTDTTSRVIRENNKDLFKPSIGVLFHIYRRSNNIALIDFLNSVIILRFCFLML